MLSDEFRRLVVDGLADAFSSMRTCVTTPHDSTPLDPQRCPIEYLLTCVAHPLVSEVTLDEK